MIAVDSSALVAIVVEEPDHVQLAEFLAINNCIIGAPTRFEALMVIRSKSSDRYMASLLKLLSQANLLTVGFTPEHVELAEQAFATYGKGQGHPAQLNFGDCMAYAVAKSAAVPLLYKGDDFSQTDIAAARLP